MPSPRSLTRVLTHTLANPKLAPDFLDQLAVGGVDGTPGRRSSRSAKTIRARQDRNAAQRRPSSGYVFGPDRSSPLAFSFIVSEVAGQPVRGAQAHRQDRGRLAVELWSEPQPKTAAR